MNSLFKVVSFSFVLAVVVAFLTIIPFIAMILSGAAGHAFHEPHLFISYGQAVLVVLILSFVGAFFGGGQGARHG